MAKLDEEEFERTHKTINYEVVLRKEPGEVGLGMVVLEDQTKKVIQIKVRNPIFLFSSFVLNGCAVRMFFLE
jgi:hypothetical protein